MSEHVVVYRWPDVLGHLELELAGIHKRMENADSDRELWELKGEARCLRKLINLPDTLTVLRGA